MKNITIAGRVTRDAEARTTQTGENVTGFSVAVDDGWGENKRTLYFDCSVWGKRGVKLADMLTKGAPVTVSGDISTREHNGKTYLTIRVAEVTLQGGSRRDDAPRDSGYSAPAGRDDMDDEVPF